MLCLQTIIVFVVVCHMVAVCRADSAGCKNTERWDDHCLTAITNDLKRCDESNYQSNCRRTCGLCGECMDMRSDCSVNNCSSNWWIIQCRKTCSACVQDVRGGGVGDETMTFKTSTPTTTWGEWVSGTCTVTCGKGRETRTRTCTPQGATCAGDASDTQDCQRPACCVPTHGQWNYWGSWSSCSQSCGGGTQTRSRTCYRPYDCVQLCEGENSESQACNVKECPTWGSWGSWTCSVTCGRGTESRKRTCTPPGARCAGVASETQDCERPACCVPRHGQWNNWGSWVQCSRSCGHGTQTRSRTCNGPNDCGRPCKGENSESRDCIVEECPRPPAVPSITTYPRTSPFSAGVTVTLTCSSSDLGYPPATLTWDTSMRTSRVDDRTTRLEIPNLSAEHDGLRVKCLAKNSVSHNETSLVLRVDQKATYGECRASVSNFTWEVTGYCDITQVFSSNNQYDCKWYENGPYRNNITSSFNLSPITPGRKLQRGKCDFQTKIPHNFPQGRELSRELKYQMHFNPGGTWSTEISISGVSPKAPTLTCPADVTEGSRINCTCSTSDVGEPQGRLLLFSNGRLEDTGQYGQQVIFLSRDAGREDNNARVSCLLHWARNMSADRVWTLSVTYVPEMPSLLVNTQEFANYTTKNNTRVDLTCQAGPGKIQSLELLKITRNGTHLLQSSKASFLFKIQKAGCADSGIYFCRAGNTVGQTNSTSVQLNVLCSPEVVNGTSETTNNLKVTEGSEGHFTFEVIGNPAPAIDGFSYHQGKSMSSSKEPVRADLLTGECKQNTPDLHLATCTLSIADAMYKDNGMYNVKVRNSEGTTNMIFQLIVEAQDSQGSASSFSWIGLVIALLIIIVIGVLIVFFVRKRRAAQTKTSEDKKKISSTAIARRNFEDPVYYNVTVADVTMPSSAATMTSATCTIHNGSAALTSPSDNVYTNYEKKTTLNDRGESSAGTASDDLYAVVDKTQKSSENSGKPPKPAPMPKPKRLGSASGKSGDNGGQGQSQNDSLVQESGDHSPPTSEAANATVNEEGLFYTELDFSQHRPQSQRPLPQKEETNYAAIDFKLQK